MDLKILSGGNGVMNETKLKAAADRFLLHYPGGFAHPLMQEVAKKHKIEKMHQLTQASFGIKQFNNPPQITEAMIKIVSQSSMVSLFEKPKFRDLVRMMSADEKEHLSQGLKAFLHGDQEWGFQLMTDLLATYKLAKWPLLTVCPYYYRPEIEVFVKPTTTKGVIAYFELEGLQYSPRPTYEFYRTYREQITAMKRNLATQLGTEDNAAFCGFLMMSLEP
jgi:hypothetical protein